MVLRRDRERRDKVEVEAVVVVVQPAEYRLVATEAVAAAVVRAAALEGAVAARADAITSPWAFRC